MELLSKSAFGTRAAAAEFMKYVRSFERIPGNSMVIGLSGELGAGKTTFMKGIAEVFGIPDEITSPTYVIEKMYDVQDEWFERLVHIDAYRLENGAELSVLGWHEMLTDPKTLVFVEWPERVFDVMPLRTIMIEFDVQSETERSIVFGEDYSRDDVPIG